MASVGSGRPARDAAHVLEVLDRVLDRGIVIDAEITLNVAGLTLAGIEARIVVATIETYLEYADELGCMAPASWGAEPDVAAEPPLLRSGLDLDVDPRHRIRPFLRDLDDLQ